MSDKATPPKTQHDTASRALATILLRQLMDGRYPAGARMPTERDMSLLHHVSRHVVREALKHLEALGLVEIHQGSGVYARDILHTGGMELFEYLLFDDGGHFESGALHDLLVFCRLFVPNVLRLAAENRTREQLDEMRGIVAERLNANMDTERLTASNLRLLRTIAQATHNTIYQLIFNNMGRLIARLRSVIPIEQLAPVITWNDLDQVLGAIEAKDSELAGLLAQRLSERAQTSVSAFIDALPLDESPANTLRFS